MQRGVLSDREARYTMVMRLSWVPFAVALAAVALSAACGSDDADCRALGETICRKACACNGGTTCRFSQAPAGTTSTKTEEGCNQYFEEACQNPAFQRIDSAKCGAEVEAAECVVDNNPLDGVAKSAKLPEACATKP